MGVSSWIAEHGLDLLQTVGIVGSLLFTAYTTRRDERATNISNLIAVKEQYRDIWSELYDRPALFRVLKKEVDLDGQPITDEEWLFVKLLVLHLDTVYRAMKADMFVKLEGFQKDIKEFFSAPIPKAIWERVKPFQDKDFVELIEASVR